MASDLACEALAVSVTEDWDIVGPVCESADFLAKNRNLSISEGGLLGYCRPEHMACHCLRIITPATEQPRF